MADVQERFPFTPLDEESVHTVFTLCGRDEPTMPKLQEFLLHSGQEAIPSPLYRMYIQDLGLGLLTTLGVNIENPMARRSMNRGILFFAGVYREVGPARKLPLNADVLEVINGSDKASTAMGARQSMDEKLCRSFRDLLGKYRRGFDDVEEYEGFEIALFGAGLACIITRKSLTEEPKGPEFPKTYTSAAVRGEIATMERNSSLQSVIQQLNNIWESSEKPTASIPNETEPVPEAMPSVPSFEPLPYLGEVDKRVVKPEGFLK